MFAKSVPLFTPVVSKLSPTLLTRSGNIFKLMLTGEDGHFLSKDLLTSLRSDLDRVKSNPPNGSVLITTASGKNFCQGFDFRCAGAVHSDTDDKDGYHEMKDLLKQLVKDLISLPMPTIAAINGYTRSAGLILAMSHDYLTMKADKHALLCMSELDNKMILPDYFAAMIRSKLTPRGAARLALDRLTFASKDAKEIGLAVKTNDADPVDTAVELAKQLSEKGWDGKVYAEIRKALYPDLCNALGLNCAPESSSRL